MLLKIVNKFERAPEDDFGEESDSELEATDGNDPDFVPSNVQKTGNGKHILILGSPMSVATPPKKSKKCSPEPFSPRTPDHNDTDDSDDNATEKSPFPRKKTLDLLNYLKVFLTIIQGKHLIMAWLILQPGSLVQR